MPALSPDASSAQNSGSKPILFGALWKGMNTEPLPDTAPVATPTRSSADLLRQARLKQNKGQSRAKVAAELRTSTQRRAAAVVAPTAAAAAPGSGFGGSGYSGNVASQLGHASNPGTVTPAGPPRPKPAG